jgi:transposase-like protein
MKEKQRKNYSPEEKVSILRRHLLEKVPVSDICDQYGLHPTVFHLWLKEFFEKGALAFKRERDNRTKILERKISELEAKVSQKNEVLNLFHPIHSVACDRDEQVI